MQKFILSSDKRTGSHYLQTSLNSVDGIACRGESYGSGNKQQKRIYDGWFEKMFDAPEFTKASGFVLQCGDGGRFGYFENLRSRIKAAYGRVKIIRLFRDDLFAQYVSRELAWKRRRWVLNTWHEPLPHVTIRIEKQHMLDYVRFRYDIWQWNLREWEGHEAITVKYEDARDNLHAQIKRCSDFLGVPPGDPVPTTQIQNPRALDAVVVNYEEALSWLGSRRIFSENVTFGEQAPPPVPASPTGEK